MAVKMGYQGLAYYGTAGSTASTQITTRTDINYSFQPERGNTTTAGAGSSPPIETQDVTVQKVQLDITLKVDTADTAFLALMTAAAAGGAIAIRLKDYTGGKGFDGDVTLDVENGLPMNGEQTKKFTCHPTASAGRAPQLYV